MTVQTVLDRGLVRGRSIWPTFQYQVPGLLAVHISDRAVVFGVYSGAYLHGYSYLGEITYETLAQMVLAYNQAMAELTADEQRSIIDVTAKRYIEDQNLAAKDAALLNKERKVVQKASEIDAKIEALEADRQALATKITELDVAQHKAATLIKELEAKIEEQVLDSAHVEAEITRQQLIAQKAQLDVIETGIRALEIQAQIAEAAYRLGSVAVRKSELESEIGRIELDTVEVDLRISQTEADTARLKTQKETEALAETELTVAQAETAAYRQETTLVKQKGPLLDNRIAAADVEIVTTIPSLSVAIDKEKDADLAVQESRNQHTVAEYENRHLSHDEKVKTSNLLKDLETGNHTLEGNMIEAHIADTREFYETGSWAYGVKLANARALSTALMKANVVNTMTHQIKAAMDGK